MLPSSGWRAAAPPVVVSLARPPAPRRRSTSTAAALLAVGQLDPHPAAAQCPTTIFTPVIHFIPLTDFCEIAGGETNLFRWFSEPNPQNNNHTIRTFHQVLSLHLLHLWDLRTLRRRNLGGSWPPRHYGGVHSSQRRAPAQFCFHCCPNFQHRLYSLGGSRGACWNLE